MLDRITQPEKFVDAETRGANWIREQKKESPKLIEIIKSFFSAESLIHPSVNVLIKALSASLLAANALHRTIPLNPSYVATGFICLGVIGAGGLTAATLETMRARELKRQKRAPKQER